MEHNQRERLLFGADGKPNNSARRMFHIAPLDVAHISASGLQAGESAHIWMRVGSGNPQTSGGAGSNTPGVDYIWAPLSVGGHACALTPESNSILIAVPGTYSIGAPSADVTFAGDVNIEHHKLDHNYIDMATAIKSAGIAAASAGDGVVAAATYDPVSGNLVLTNTVGGTVTVNVPGIPDVLTTLGLSGTDLTYTDEEGNDTVLDLSTLLDDTNLPRIVSGSLDSGVLTLTRDDGSEFDVDLTALLETVTTLEDFGDGTYVYTSEDGTQTKFSTADVVTTLVDNGDGTFTYTSEDGTQTTLDLSDIVMVGATATADGAQGDVPQPVAGEQDFVLHGDGTWRELASCPEPMTRSALLALRNAGSLEVGCHYVITDYNRANVGAASILLHAVDGGTLSMDASVKTAFDAEAWSGTYDITTNRIESLRDNIGNHVTERAAVDAFPWGVSTVSGNRVDGSIVTVTGGSFLNNTVRDGSVVNQSAGTTRESTIADQSDLTNNGASLSNVNLRSDSTLVAATGSWIEVSVSDSYIVYQVGTGYVRYSSFSGNHTLTVGDVNITDVHARSSTINTTGSTGTISRSTFDGSSGVSLLNIPVLNIIAIGVRDQAQIVASGAAQLTLRYTTLDSGGRFLASAGTRTNCQYSAVNSYGYIQNVQGTMTVLYCSATSLGYIRHNTPNTNLFERLSVTSQSNARIEGAATNCRLYYSSANGGSTLLINGASDGAYVYYCSADGLSELRITDSVGTRMYYCSAMGRGFITCVGDATQTLMYYCAADSAGRVESLNNDAAGTRMYSCRADSQSILRLQNCGANGRVYYSSVTAYYYLLLTLNGLTRSALHGYGRRSYTVTDPAANGTFVQNF